MENTKFKVGDHVKVKDKYSCGNCKGKILTIISINHINCVFPIKCKGVNSNYECFNENNLILIEPTDYNKLLESYEEIKPTEYKRLKEEDKSNYHSYTIRIGHKYFKKKVNTPIKIEHQGYVVKLYESGNAEFYNNKINIQSLLPTFIPKELLDKIEEARKRLK